MLLHYLPYSYLLITAPRREHSKYEKLDQLASWMKKRLRSLPLRLMMDIQYEQELIFFQFKLLKLGDCYYLQCKHNPVFLNIEVRGAADFSSGLIPRLNYVIKDSDFSIFHSLESTDTKRGSSFRICIQMWNSKSKTKKHLFSTLLLWAGNFQEKTFIPHWLELCHKPILNQPLAIEVEFSWLP